LILNVSVSALPRERAMKVKILTIFGVVLIVGSVWAATKPTDGAIAQTRLSLKNESMASLDQFLRSKLDLSSEMVSPALEKRMSDFALNCFKPHKPHKPLVSGYFGGWWD